MNSATAGPLLMNLPAPIVCGTEWVAVWKPFRVEVHRTLEAGGRFRDFRIEWRRKSCGVGGFRVEQLGA